jgi:hypothetical protein
VTNEAISLLEGKGNVAAVRTARWRSSSSKAPDPPSTSTENPLGLPCMVAERIVSRGLPGVWARPTTDVRPESGRRRHRREHSKREAGSDQPACGRLGEHLWSPPSLRRSRLDARFGGPPIASGECLSRIRVLPLASSGRDAALRLYGAVLGRVSVT